jgi:hypothetical protein
VLGSISRHRSAQHGQEEKGGNRGKEMVIRTKNGFLLALPALTM